MSMMGRKSLAGAAALALIATVVLGIWELRIIADATTTKYFHLQAADLFSYSYPVFETAYSELRAGRLSFWNPYQLCGTGELAAAPGAGLLYPLHWLYLLFPTASALEYLSVLHLVLAVFFATTAGRVFRLSWIASLVVGFTYGLCGVLPVVYWPSWAESLVWLPLGIAAMERWITARDSRWLPGISVAAAMPWLTSNPGTTVQEYYAYGIYLAVTLGSLVLSGEAFWTTLRRFFPVLLAFAAGIALAAPKIFPTMELAQHSVRMAERASFDDLRAFLLPFGQPSYAQVVAKLLVPSGTFGLGYLGAVPFALACAALTKGLRRVEVFCILLACWGALEMLTPGWYLQLRTNLPVLGLLRTPPRTFCVAVFGMALLAGVGYDTLASTTSAQRWRRMALGGVLAGSAYAAWLRYPDPSVYVVIGLCGVAIAAVLARARPALAPLLGAVTLALVVADLVGFTRNTTILPYVDENWRLTQAQKPLLQEVRELAGLERILLVDADNGRAAWAPKTATLEKFYTIQDYEPLGSRRYGDFFSYAAYGKLRSQASRIPFGGFLEPAWYRQADGRQRRFLNLLSVRYIVTPRLNLLDPAIGTFLRGLEPVTSKVEGSGTKAAQNSFTTFRNPDALPRAYAVHRAECYPDLEDQLARLAAPEFDPRNTVILEGTCEQDVLPAPVRPPRVTIESYGADAVRLSAQLESPGWLILTDSHYPGWQATVNGTNAEIWRANAVVRAVPLPAGSSRIEFRFVPWSFYAGLAVAITTVTMFAMWRLRQRRRPVS